MPNVLARYEALVASGELRPDPAQKDAASRLAALATALETQEKPGLIGRLFGRAPEPLRGIYMWGGVGRGKSMLMDLFHSCLKIEQKRRVHFHEFMAEVHDRLRREREKEAGDPIPPVAAALAEDVRVLAFDELVVTNMADAAILSRLFIGLFDRGVTIVATSNRVPGDLYKNGLNRHLFLPFIALIEQKMDVIALNGPTDYRLDRLGNGETWHVPTGDAATQAVTDAFFRLTDFDPADRANVPSEDLAIPGGRVLHVPKSLKGVGVFSFKRLCGEPRGVPDYLAIARHFHTVIIVGIPRMGPENRNEAARFVTLIDALYEHKVKLLATADAQPDDLYIAGDGAFEFERTASRLMEMRSADYLALGHGAE
ncbi:AFG1 family ATPase [Roseomonas aeriglobus]|nr:AFG1 family ATPase [Roseomonas aeriglobus]